MSNLKYFPGCGPQQTAPKDNEKSIKISLPEGELVALTLMLMESSTVYALKGKDLPPMLDAIRSLQNRLADAWNIAK